MDHFAAKTPAAGARIFVRSGSSRCSSRMRRARARVRIGSCSSCTSATDRARARGRWPERPVVGRPWRGAGASATLGEVGIEPLQACEVGIRTRILELEHARRATAALGVAIALRRDLDLPRFDRAKLADEGQQRSHHRPRRTVMGKLDVDGAQAPWCRVVGLGEGGEHPAHEVLAWPLRADVLGQLPLDACSSRRRGLDRRRVLLAALACRCVVGGSPRRGGCSASLRVARLRFELRASSGDRFGIAAEDRVRRERGSRAERLWRLGVARPQEPRDEAGDHGHGQGDEGRAHREGSFRGGSDGALDDGRGR